MSFENVDSKQTDFEKADFQKADPKAPPRKSMDFEHEAGPDTKPDSGNSDHDLENSMFRTAFGDDMTTADSELRKIAQITLQAQSNEGDEAGHERVVRDDLGKRDKGFAEALLAAVQSGEALGVGARAGGGGGVLHRNEGHLKTMDQTGVSTYTVGATS